MTSPSQPTLPLTATSTTSATEPVARATDPQTSWDAARSVTGLNVRQAHIYTILLNFGSMTDERILDEYLYRFDFISPSGCRTRRKELVEFGLVEDSGRRTPLVSGRLSIEWQAVR